MLGSTVVYLGLVVAFAGLLLTIKPVSRFGVRTRPRALLLFGAGISLTAIGLILPARESRVTEKQSRLDELIPVWQFSEHHQIEIAASPERVFAAIREVRADEIALFRTLTWIRRGGKDAPESILNPGTRKPLLDVALSSGFSLLADDAPREVVIGTVPTSGTFAAMNFAVRLQGSNRSILTTETRVFAGTASATRRFGAYWRLIYPGSALIRRMWLRAIAKRASVPPSP